jgi:hypothetical protein
MESSLFFKLLLLTLIPFGLFGQTQNEPYDWRAGMSDPEANYLEILEGARTHFASVPDDPSYKNFCRWNRFWSDRHGSDTDSGTFVPAYNELHKILTGTSLTPICGGSPESYEPWKSLGPNTIPLNENSANGMGIVTKVLVDHRDV